MRAHIEKGSVWLKEAGAAVGQTMQTLTMALADKVAAANQTQARQACEIERQRGRERQAQIEAQRDRDDRKPDRGIGR